jgi:hypothetical protein
VVTVELSAESVYTDDVTNRYFTIETFEITDDWNTWPNKVILNKGTIGPFYRRCVDLPPGTNKIWVGVTNFIGSWRFRIRVRVVSTGQIIADIDDYHGPFVNSYTISVPNAPNAPCSGGVSTGGGGGGGTTGTTPFDPSELVRQMMENMLPPMMQMMGMMMVMNMMVSLMQGMASAFAGGF